MVPRFHLCVVVITLAASPLTQNWHVDSQPPAIATPDRLAGKAARRKDRMMAIPSALATALDNLLCATHSPVNTDPAELHDTAQRFVEELSKDAAAIAELMRRGTFCARLTAESSDYSNARMNAQRALAGWDPAAQFTGGSAFVPVELAQSYVHALRQAAGEEQVARVEETCQSIEGLLAMKWLPPAIRPFLKAWRDAASSVVSRGEDESLDGCWWLLHTEHLKHTAAYIVSKAGPKIRLAAESLVKWVDAQGKEGTKNGVGSL